MSSVLRNLVALALLLFVTRGADSPAIYWVFLHEHAARSTLPPAVSAEALAERPVLDTDRPVNPGVIEAVAASGARVLYASRWLRAVGVEADARTLRRLARLPEVRGVRAARVGFVAGSDGANTPVLQDSAHYGPTYAALRELGIPVLHSPAIDITGAAIRVGLVDTGFFLLHETLRDRFVRAQRDFIDNDNNTGPEGSDAPNQARHGTHVLSLLGGYAPGRFVGGAYNAHFVLAKVKRVGEDSRADELRWVAGVEWLDSVGVQIINSSIGFREFSDRQDIEYGDLDGNTTITTRMADEAARRGILVVIAMGNRGPSSGSLWAPADADSVISVGSVDSLVGNRIARPTDISSRGPTVDGRTKPELAARAGNVIAASLSAPGDYEVGLTGSSYAAPLIAASAALFMEAWPDYRAMAVRTALMLAGSDALRPNHVTGFGVPDVAAAIMLPSGLVLGPIGSTDLAGRVTTIAPTFRWEAPVRHPRMTPIMYRVEVAVDSFFQTLLYSDTIGEAFALTARVPLRPVQPAYWRVVATSPQGVRRVSTQTGSFVVPDWVTLLTLAEPRTQFIDEPRPQLSWGPLQAPAPFGPFTYDVQILSATNQVIQQMRDLTTASVRVPEPLSPNESYRWRVIAKTRVGVADTVESPAQFVVISPGAPPATLLYNPFPNPFPNFNVGLMNLHVWFDIAERTAVELTVHDTRGRLVRRMIPAHPQCPAIVLDPGLYGRSGQVFNVPAAAGEPCATAAWDGTDTRGERVPAGVYIVRLRAGRTASARPVVFRGR